MKVINFGSLNIDHVYHVPRFAKPGETLAGLDYACFVGGKGLNQSLALARAGAQVIHAGCIGHDGEVLKQTLRQSGVDVSQIVSKDVASGHAIIQVNPEGENCILLYGGANQHVDVNIIQSTLDRAEQGDILVLQNEINAVDEIIRRAADQGLTIVFNPAPMSSEVLRYPLDRVDYLIVNETEAQQFTHQTHRRALEDALLQQFPTQRLVLTRGAQGAIYLDTQQHIKVAAVKTVAVDTTAAGDTFIGYFVAALCAGDTIRQGLQIACKAASICVQQAGAANSIPYRKDVEDHPKST